MRDTLSVLQFRPWSWTLGRHIVRWVSQPEVVALIGGLNFVWAIGGRPARLSDDWHPLVGLGTILATFIVVCLIQNAPSAESDNAGESLLIPARGAESGETPL